MTTANKITLTRIAMIPFFLYFASQPMLLHDEATQVQTMVPAFLFPTATVVALVLFCVASFTDFLDGYVARKYNQVTDFGKFVDPLADKLLVTSALVLFAEQGAFAGWMVCVILARELIVSGLRMVAAAKGAVLAADMIGKVKTTVQDIAVAALLAGADIFSLQETAGAVVCAVGLIGIALATVLTVWSGAVYLIKNRNILKEKREE